MRKVLPYFCLNMIFKQFQHFKLKIVFCSLSKNLFTKKVIFLKFDTENGFSDSFPFRKCTFLYTSQLQLKSYNALFFFKISGLTPTLTVVQLLVDIRVEKPIGNCISSLMEYIEPPEYEMFDLSIHKTLNDTSLMFLIGHWR